MVVLSFSWLKNFTNSENSVKKIWYVTCIKILVFLLFACKKYVTVWSRIVYNTTVALPTTQMQEFKAGHNILVLEKKILQSPLPRNLKKTLEMEEFIFITFISNSNISQYGTKFTLNVTKSMLSRTQMYWNYIKKWILKILIWEIIENSGKCQNILAFCFWYW